MDSLAFCFLPGQDILICAKFIQRLKAHTISHALTLLLRNFVIAHVASKWLAISTPQAFRRFNKSLTTSEELASGGLIAGRSLPSVHFGPNPMRLGDLKEMEEKDAEAYVRSEFAKSKDANEATYIHIAATLIRQEWQQKEQYKKSGGTDAQCPRRLHARAKTT
jgi:hypothetical protein